MTKYPFESNSGLNKIFVSAMRGKEVTMKNITKASAKANASAKASVVKSTLNISVLASYIGSLRKTDETFSNLWNECRGDEKLEPLGKYLEGEAMKMIEDKPRVGAVPVYLEDSTMRNWIIDFLNEHKAEETKETPVATPKVEPEIKKPISKAEKKVVPVEKPASVPTKETKSKPVPSIKKVAPKIYAAIAKKEGCAVLVRAYDEDKAMEIAKAKAKAELNRQRLKMELVCVSEGNAKSIVLSSVTINPATSEADTHCFVYTDLSGQYGIVFGADWDSASEKICDTIVDEYDEFTDESWAEIENGMVFCS